MMSKYFLPWTIYFVTLFTFASAQEQASATCVYTCLNRFTATADRIMGPSGRNSAGGVSWQNLLQMTNGGQIQRTEQEMRKNFDDMCSSFRTMKRCVQQCRDIWLRDSVVSGFASIQYVCEDRYQEFVTHLPCLAANEGRVVERCKRETNQTAAAIAALEKTVFENDVAQMTPTLAALCRNTSEIVNCLTPATEETCGKRPAAILRRLVTLGFRSIEQMYRRMKIEDKLPQECANLANGFNDDIVDSLQLAGRPISPGTRFYPTLPPSSTRFSETNMRNDQNDVDTYNDAYHQMGHTNSASQTISSMINWSQKIIISLVLAQVYRTY